MKKVLLFILILGNVMTAQMKFDLIQKEIDEGNFLIATEMIEKKLDDNSTESYEKYELEFLLEKMNRIKKDFRLTSEDVLGYIHKYIPEATEVELGKWRKAGSLEYKTIDGEIKYFNRSDENLFRINLDAKKRKLEVTGDITPEPKAFLQKHIPEAVKVYEEENKNLIKPVHLKLDYTLTVDADAVPAGEVIRCWLPYPRENHKRQSEVKFVSANIDEYVIAANENPQRTIYMEKISEAGLPTVFNVKFEMKNYNQVYDVNEKNIKPYKKESELYKNYTSESLPHIMFTDKVKELSKKIVGDETNPYLKAKKIFTWISKNVPWAGAREYSTIESISDYCLTKGYGDCGIKAMTFITLCRYNGIPAKWQSGWMIYPTKLNLHDWAEVYFEGHGWVPVDADFGLVESSNENVLNFYFCGMDSYRLIINDDFSQPLFPAKIFPRSETVDFQRGEVEWKGGNLYFDKWDYKLNVDFK